MMLFIKSLAVSQYCGITPLRGGMLPQLMLTTAFFWTLREMMSCLTKSKTTAVSDIVWLVLTAIMVANLATPKRAPPALDAAQVEWPFGELSCKPGCAHGATMGFGSTRPVRSYIAQSTTYTLLPSDRALCKW